MKRLVPLVAAVLLVAACGGTTENASTSPSADATASVSPSPMAVACTYPAEIAALVGTPATTARIADFVAAPNYLTGEAAPAGLTSPFDGQALYFAPDAPGGSGGENPAPENGGFAAGSPISIAAGMTTNAVLLPVTPASEGGASIFTSLTDVFGLASIGAIKLDGDVLADFMDLNGGAVAGLFAASTEAAQRRIGGIAVGADALFYQFGSSLADILGAEDLVFDFPYLAIAHHPNAASAEAAIGWIKGLPGTRPTVAYCVDGVMVDFAVVSAAEIGIPADQLEVFGISGEDLNGVTHELSLAIAQVEAAGGHYVIARTIVPADAGHRLAGHGLSDDFQLAVWPTGTKR